jgi:SAM-dependent methyltransferase
MTIANTGQYDSWNGDSGHRWVARADERDAVLAPVGDVLLAAAALRPGASVLDIGCGCGATTLAAADAVGPTGSAVGLDLSEPMLDLARRRAQRRSAGHVTFTQSDAQVHQFEPAGVDVVVSRFGTMFFDDPVAAFTNIANALQPGGRLCLATWRPLADNEWLVAPGAVLLQHTNLPAGVADGPGMFAQADPEVVTDVLTTAGYRDVHLEPVDVTFDLGSSPEAAADYLADSGPGRLLLDSIPEGPARDAALTDVQAHLQTKQRDGAVRLGAAIWIIEATRR